MVGFVHDPCRWIRLAVCLAMGKEGVGVLPLVANEARNESCPEANAGWMFGRPPSVPTLSMLYLRVERKCYCLVLISD